MTLHANQLCTGPKPTLSRLFARRPLPVTLSFTYLRPLVLASLIWLGAASSHAAPSACLADAAAWIAGLNSPQAELLLRNARTRCDAAALWLQHNRHDAASANYRGLCQSLVLVQTHNQCVTFRDKVDHRAYNPCETWSRNMFKRCLAGDREWFLPISSQ
jgi:hypothetical protein